MNQQVTGQGISGSQPHRMSAEDYIRLIMAGGFGDAHVELVEGELVEMSPSHSKHGKLLGRISFDLTTIYQLIGYEIQIDTIVQLSDSTVRAPDISVVDGKSIDREKLLPADILLAVEIAGSTLAVDIGQKRIDYASSGIRHYWVVDVEGRRVHCYADPQGADYAAIKVVPFGGKVPVPGAEGAITVA
jgi:Uma2 family endonuclease